MTKIGLLGCGRLGEIIAGALHDGKVPGCKLVGVMGRGMERATRLAEQYGCTACQSADELLALKPDYVIEAATAQALKDCVLSFLAGGCHVICISVGAFADEDFYNQAAQTAQQHHTKVYLASGVIGGFDIASTLSLMGELKGTLIKYKYPNDSGRCPPALMELPDEFQGSAREGFSLSPAHLNIAVAAALVCGSLDETSIKIEPTLEEDSPSFGFDLDGEFASASLRVRQGGFGGKPKGPVLAAWSTIALLRRLTAPITFA
jgi:aspartate dehydrogenase